ncbi:MAG: potassium-transporting ATPase subunit KdpC [Bacteroidia bacterium]|nr:potassium-transporting ATPase subunit KdpC [Bacteroidia bacterium]
MKTFMTSLKLFLFFTVLTGVFYPLAVTVIAQLAFPTKANGSLIVQNEMVIGSKLIGQSFDSTAYFTSRPSAIAYQTMPSGGSNLGLTSGKLKKVVEDRKMQFIVFNQLANHTNIPSEMLFASASGLDPHISPKAAILQVNRIAVVRRLSAAQKQQLLQLINQHTEQPQYYFLGEKRVNVLQLNLSMDALTK